MRDVIDRVGARFPRLFLGQILVAAGVFVGSLLILPGIYFGVRAALYRQAIVVGNAPPLRAIRESFRRVDDVRSFFVILLFLAAWVAAEFGLEEALLAAGASAAAAGAVLVPISGLLLSILNCLLTILYLEREPRPLVDRTAGTT